MSEQQEKVFPNGLIFTRKREGVPDFVLGGVSIKVEEFVEFLQKHKKADGWVNLDFLKPKDKDKRPYFSLNTWEPPKKEDGDNLDKQDIPFN